MSIFEKITVLINVSNLIVHTLLFVIALLTLIFSLRDTFRKRSDTFSRMKYEKEKASKQDNQKVS
ncbi:hypothetical protein CHCC5022_1505 [Bacillus paralicheniformis]|nr:hypothetical protein DJ88_3430 [Bacillus paralicheniformis]TWJ53576.1 hypothetical protein CHCC5022_1505 [Bacillus paralicheniformis]TWJ83808.1 hypothetical protein CHCC4186_2986 [Bacillus paralicheniformis]BCE06654.1 hypothetical protein RSC1_02811 [Bacillus paralicheniformis]BCE08447.1 hypothetical protein RSC2_00243 [Bacillus paralicheniformis]